MSSIACRLGPRLALAALATSCQTLEHEPWSQVQAGTQSVSAITGWSSYYAEARFEGESGALEGMEDSDRSVLTPQFGAFVDYKHYLSESFALGAYGGVRSFDPEPATVFGAEFDAEAFETIHLFLTSRYFLPPIGQSRRWRPFLGLDLGYIPEVPLDATVDYGGGFTEEVEYDGDDYWTLGFLGAVSYLLRDNLSVEFGAFWEKALDTTDATLTLNVPGAGPARVDGELEPGEWIYFVSLTYYF